MTPKKTKFGFKKSCQSQTSNRSEVTAYIQGVGHSLSEHGIVLIRGGRVKDLPGVNIILYQR